MKIRLVSDADLPFLKKLVVELGYEPTAHFEEMFRKILDSNSMGIFIAEDNEVVGYLAYSVKPQLRLGGFCFEIDELVVTQKIRSRGVGAKLIETAKNKARELNCVRISVLNNRARESYLRNFYPQKGFEEANTAVFRIPL